MFNDFSLFFIADLLPCLLEVRVPLFLANRGVLRDSYYLHIPILIAGLKTAWHEKPTEVSSRVEMMCETKTALSSMKGHVYLSMYKQFTQPRRHNVNTIHIDKCTYIKCNGNYFVNPKSFRQLNFYESVRNMCLGEIMYVLYDIHSNSWQYIRIGWRRLQIFVIYSSAKCE